jgi:hypothetical protein
MCYQQPALLSCPNGLVNVFRIEDPYLKEENPFYQHPIDACDCRGNADLMADVQERFVKLVGDVLAKVCWRQTTCDATELFKTVLEDRLSIRAPIAPRWNKMWFCVNVHFSCQASK